MATRLQNGVIQKIKRIIVTELINLYLKDQLNSMPNLKILLLSDLLKMGRTLV
jgi:hypothetical protein